MTITSFTKRALIVAGALTLGAHSLPTVLLMRTKTLLLSKAPRLLQRFLPLLAVLWKSFIPVGVSAQSKHKLCRWMILKIRPCRQSTSGLTFGPRLMVLLVNLARLATMMPRPA